MRSPATPLLAALRPTTLWPDQLQPSQPCLQLLSAAQVLIPPSRPNIIPPLSLAFCPFYLWTGFPTTCPGRVWRGGIFQPEQVTPSFLRPSALRQHWSTPF